MVEEISQIKYQAEFLPKNTVFLTDKRSLNIRLNQVVATYRYLDGAQLTIYALPHPRVGKVASNQTKNSIRSSQDSWILPLCTGSPFL